LMPLQYPSGLAVTRCCRWCSRTMRGHARGCTSRTCRLCAQAMTQTTHL
jgi:hypothetical protein